MSPLCLEWAPGMVMLLVYLSGRSFLQAHEDTGSVLFAAVAANVVNLVLDLVLVFGDDGLRSVGLPGIGLPALGAVGAGITTAFSSLTLATILVVRARRFRPDRAAIAANPQESDGHSWEGDSRGNLAVR